MRWILVALLVCCSGVTYGQKEKQWFKLPFAQDPPPLVKKIMEDAERDIRNSVKTVLKDTESRLKDELGRLQEKKRLDEANFAEATLNVFKTWLLRQEFYNQTPSPVGKWKTPDGSMVTLYADHTGDASWHSYDVLWAEDGLGIIRIICARGHRNISKLVFQKTRDGNGALNSDVLENPEEPSDFWVRIKN